MSITLSVSTERAVNEALAFPRNLTESQREIASLLVPIGRNGRRRADACMPNREILDKLVNGKPMQEEEKSNIANWTEWVSELTGALDWLRDISWAALKELLGRNDDEIEVASRLADLSVYEGDVLRALADAYPQHFKDLVKMSIFDGHSSECATLDLAKRYRLYARQVELLLFEAFPDLNGDLLLNADFEFHESKPAESV